jgi:hypothetical protein
MVFSFALTIVGLLFVIAGLIAAVASLRSSADFLIPLAGGLPASA